MPANLVNRRINTIGFKIYNNDQILCETAIPFDRQITFETKMAMPVYMKTTRKTTLGFSKHSIMNKSCVWFEDPSSREHSRKIAFNNVSNILTIDNQSL